MLGRLIKHDFRSLSRVLMPTQLAILGATVIATAGFAVNIRSGYSSFNGDFAAQALRVVTAFLSGLMLVAIFASVFLVAFIIFQRFYKSFMCDEGYLTFTLPVTTSQLLWSKLITALLWSIINGAVLLVCIFIFMAFGTSTKAFFNAELFRQMGLFFSEANALFGARLILPSFEFIVMMLITLAFNIISVYLSLIIGGVLSQAHKILAAIGVYFGINIVVGILTSIAQTIWFTSVFTGSNAIISYSLDTATPAQAFDAIFAAVNPLLLFIIILSAVLSVAFFILSHYLLKNKLNLE